ncbi:SPX domain-containing membrane protein At4g11810-like isoform X2 [Syzygium oleosum]|uniref:SPX domain-containing membrane protein At4g11810-like isoform X2 n=1 Tax=Syzygium oleosum TaxID=219896 RepID=UPI0024BAE469|nr:SPX domain-containing membrane protein At4g11810-like isoform X2 [Syzygium oleosum]
MVAFGKKLKERQIQEWQGYYINYKLMKKKVRQYAQQIQVGTQDRRHVLKDFSRMLDHQGIGAVVGAISRNLAELEDRQGSYLSIYDQPALPLQDPTVELIKAAVDRLTHSTNFLHFLAQHALILQEELPTPVEEQVDDGRYHFMSLLLNLANTFLYMVNTYIIVPTADDYATSLGAAATVCGVVIGAMAVAQVFSSVYFSAWSNKSYFRPLVFSSIVLFLGNTMYAMAYDLDSIAILLIGRLLCGFGSARAVNRRYISDCVPMKIRMQASAGFVSASALGMACGPALAGLFQCHFKFFKITFNQETLPGWAMAVGWLLYLVWLWISFREPSHEKEPSHTPEESNEESLQTDALENGLEQPLLISSEEKNEGENDDQEFDGSDEASEESHQPATSIASAYRLLTPSVKVQLLIYFMLKYAMEILLSESSVITSYYFRWSTTKVAIFLACLGLTVLPVNIIVGTYISNMFEDRQILLASEVMVFIGIVLSFHLIIPYSVAQYVSSGLIMFVSAEVLEGVNLSLLSRVMSSRLSRGTYNGGLLSTEAGTIARVIADGTITLAGYLGESRLLNITLLPSLVICISSIMATLYTYNSLY